jgi:hypothetical protein
MDVLSEVLQSVRLQGALFFNGEFSAPWCFQSVRPSNIASFLSLEAEHVIIFHFLTAGRAFAQLSDGRREELTAGDIIIFPHGDGHVIGNGSAVQTVDAWREFAKNVSDGLKLVRFGGGGEPTRFVCGFLACDPRLSQGFLSGLPPMLKVHVANEPSGQWLEHSIRFSVEQASTSNSGSDLVIAKLSEVLFRRDAATLHHGAARGPDRLARGVRAIRISARRFLCSTKSRRMRGPSRIWLDVSVFHARALPIASGIFSENRRWPIWRNGD